MSPRIHTKSRFLGYLGPWGRDCWFLTQAGLGWVSDTDPRESPQRGEESEAEAGAARQRSGRAAPRRALCRAWAPLAAGGVIRPACPCPNELAPSANTAAVEGSRPGIRKTFPSLAKMSLTKNHPVASHFVLPPRLQSGFRRLKLRANILCWLCQVRGFELGLGHKYKAACELVGQVVETVRVLCVAETGLVSSAEGRAAARLLLEATRRAVSRE